LKLLPVFKSVEASQEFAKLTSITKVLTLKYVQYVAKNKKAPVTEKDLELDKICGSGNGGGHVVGVFGEERSVQGSWE